MKLQSPGLFLLLFAAAAAASPAQHDQPSAGPIPLLYALEQGGTFNYSVEIVAKVELGEAAENSLVRFMLHFGTRVDRAPTAPGAPAEVTHCLTRIEAKTRSLIANSEYDSDDTHADPGAWSPMREMIGKTFKTRVDATGRIHGVELPADMPDTSRRIDGSEFETLFALYFIPLPNEPIRIGDSWESHARLVDKGIATGSRAVVTNKLRSIDNNRAHIVREFHLPTPRRAGVTFELQQSDGQAVLDLATGRIVEAQMRLIAKASKGIGEGARLTGTSEVVITLRTNEPSSGL